MMLDSQILELANQKMRPPEIAHKLNMEGREREIYEVLRDQTRDDLRDEDFKE